MLHCALGDRELRDVDAVCSKILGGFLFIMFLTLFWAEEKMFASAFRRIELHSRH